MSDITSKKLVEQFDGVRMVKLFGWYRWLLSCSGGTYLLIVLLIDTSPLTTNIILVLSKNNLNCNYIQAQILIKKSHSVPMEVNGSTGTYSQMIKKKYKNIREASQITVHQIDWNNDHRCT
jgi:hypothetical protein